VAVAEDACRPEDLEIQVQRVTRSLLSARPAVPEDLVERTVRECFAECQGARIRDFVGVLAERAARERLRQLAADSRERSSA